MNKLVSKFVDYLVVNRISCKEMREIHIYGFEVMIGKILSYGSLLMLSWINRNILQTLVFMVIFFTLRSRSGGFHAKKFLHCYFGTVIMYFFVSKILVYILLIYKSALLYVVVISIIIVFLLAPVNHPDLRLKDNEIQRCKNSARKLIIYISICAIALEKLDIIPEYNCYAVAGIGINAGLLLTAKILNQEVR